MNVYWYCNLERDLLDLVHTQVRDRIILIGHAHPVGERIITRERYVEGVLSQSLVLHTQEIHHGVSRIDLGDISPVREEIYLIKRIDLGDAGDGISFIYPLVLCILGCGCYIDRVLTGRLVVRNFHG